MVQVMLCPDMEQLKRIALGDPALPDGDALIEHIANCSACANRLGSINAVDAIVEAVRCQDAMPAPQQQAVRSLLRKVRAIVGDTGSYEGQHTVDSVPSDSPASAGGGASMFPGSIRRGKRKKIRTMASRRRRLPTSWADSDPIGCSSCSAKAAWARFSWLRIPLYSARWPSK